MPELPEVETIKRQLEKVLIGKQVIEVCVHVPKVIKGISPANFKKSLEGQTIKNILRKAKVLIIELSNGKSLVIHLKMTGQLVYPGDAKASRISFHLSDGKTLDFNDQRLFAEVRLMDDWSTLPFIQGLGPEPFDITAQGFREKLSKKKTAVKPLLMDQAFIAGVGNLYAAEALFRARISPTRSAAELSDKEKDALLQAIQEVLRAAIEHRGSSVDQYVQLSGEPGGYVKFHKVYGRDGKPCLVCKATIKRIAQGGRGTYYCPKCQR